MNIHINKHLFAAYCGMIKSGYDLMDLSDEVVSNIYTWVSCADFGKEISDYFLFTKTNTVSVNPYYPRGSDLSAACFFQDTGIDKYIEFLQLCESPEANNPKFIKWISELPDILRQIEGHRAFDDIYQYYRKCLEKRFIHVSKQMVEIEKILKAKPFITQTSVIFAPNLLQAKFLADYALVEDTLYIISGVFWSCAVIHEYLHIALKPVRGMLLDIVQDREIDKYVDVNCMLELGYLHGDTAEYRAHMLDECLVRALCGVIDKSLNLSDYCQMNVQNGFCSVPQMMNNLSGCTWSDMTLKEIVLQAVNITN